ncbi:DUF4435 domain-containing protein [Vibrio parahaemolyticus]|uniref:DUF4435 domain-containing protein n=1 Tax=Vibrio parahaemolyticus TaxID=670 RepID=UPI002806C3D1|nr:DUF4435 domain-containing protein [Vibrio parahaemolyticus]
MASFLDYLTDPDFIKAHGVVKHGNESVGYIYIENEKDISFWKVFFGEEILQSYEFNATKNPDSVACGTRGKTRFDDLMCNANKSAVFALDSDIDHFTPQRFTRCKDIIDNPFVIHTYGYGKESFTNSCEVLNSCLGSYYYFRPSSYRFNTFLESYSKLIYPVLIKFLHLLNTHEDITDESRLRAELIPSEIELCKMYFENDYSSFNASISGFEQELDQLLQGEDFSTTKQHCMRFGLKEENTYQFVNGHDLEDKIVKVIVNQIKCRIISAELDTYKNEGAQGKMIGDRSNELKTHFDEHVRFSTLRNVNQAFLANELFRASQEQITALKN